MNRFWIVLALGAMWAAGAGCQGPPSLTPGPRAGEELSKLGLKVYWECRLPLDTGESVTALHRLEDDVYCLTNAGRLIALDAMTGVRRWEVTVGAGRERVFRPLRARGMVLTEDVPGIGQILSRSGTPMPAFEAVVLNTASQVLVIRRSDGRVVRRIPLDIMANCGGCTDGQYFFVGDSRGWYCAMALQEAIRVWTMSTGEAISSPLEFAGGALYVASTDGTVRTIKGGAVPQELLRKTLGGPVSAAIQLDARGCFVPCEDGRLYAFTPGLAQRLWDHPFVCRGPLRRAAQVGEKTVFQKAEGDRFYAVNLVSGQERWSLPEGEQVLAVSGGDVLVRDSGNRLLVVDEILGTVKNSARLTGLDLFVGNTTSETIWAGWRHGRVVCIRPASAGHVTTDMLRRAAR